jgi:hypothetical protein
MYRPQAAGTSDVLLYVHSYILDLFPAHYLQTNWLQHLHCQEDLVACLDDLAISRE